MSTFLRDLAHFVVKRAFGDPFAKVKLGLANQPLSAPATLRTPTSPARISNFLAQGNLGRYPGTFLPGPPTPLVAPATRLRATSTTSLFANAATGDLDKSIARAKKVLGQGSFTPALATQGQAAESRGDLGSDALNSASPNMFGD